MTALHSSSDGFDLSDSTLVALAKSGDRPAIEQLAGKYWQFAYRTAMRFLGSHADAEEAAQDILMSAIRHLTNFREDALFRTWLRRIAVNHSLMRLRRRNRRRDSADLSIETLVDSTGGPRTPEQLLLEAEYQKVVSEGLSQLPAPYRVIVQLSVCEGKSTAEVAEHMSLSTQAVKTRLHRGRGRLRKEIGRHLRLRGTARLTETTRARIVGVKAAA